MVTRPQHQTEPLCRRIETAGGRAIRLPVLEIREPKDHDRLDNLIDRLCVFDIAIFASPNAVQQAESRVQARGASLAHLKLGAIGQKTAQTLAALGYSVHIYPQQGFTTEDLLALDEMHAVRGNHIVIFRGEGGRELLAETLRARGAAVEYAEVYRRVKPHIDRQTLRRYFDDSGIDLIIVTSSEGLRNLDAMCGSKLALRIRQIPLLVGSHRILQIAREMSFTAAMAARDPSDEAIFEGILQWADKRRN